MLYNSQHQDLKKHSYSVISAFLLPSELHFCLIPAAALAEFGHDRYTTHAFLSLQVIA